MHQPGIEPGAPAWQAEILPLNHWYFDMLWWADILILFEKCNNSPKKGEEIGKESEFSRILKLYSPWLQLLSPGPSFFGNQCCLHWFAKIPIFLLFPQNFLSSFPKAGHVIHCRFLKYGPVLFIENNQAMLRWASTFNLAASDMIIKYLCVRVSD